jgi:glycosyltransferase involved in cell wall biosynthesis
MKNIYFSYVIQKNFSGQSRATEQIIESLDSNQFKPVVLKQFSFDRKQNKIYSFFKWVFNTLSIFPKLVKLFCDKRPILHLTLGQEFASVFRILWWYAPLVLFKKSTLFISLNGRNFQSWRKDDIISIVFTWILKNCKKVSVVGPNQRNTLITDFSLCEDKIEIIPNTSDFEIISESNFEAKFQNTKKIQLLFLGLLIESKGFKLYIDSLLYMISQKEIATPIKAHVCGTISFTKYCRSFKNSETLVREYINKNIFEIKKIAKEKNIDFELIWINGIRGLEKQQIFHDSHLFIFPTSFPTESQPLVIMEAMSSGCAILTTRIGEIPYVVGQETQYIDNLTVEELSNKIYSMISNFNNLKINGESNLNKFKSKFDIKSYSNKWNDLIRNYL